MKAGCSYFNLLDEEWIRLATASGAEKSVSLTEAFKMAHEVTGIAGEMPQMNFALLRLMEAVLYRAYAVPTGDARTARALWRELWQRGRFDMDEIGPYLEGCRDGFYLIDSARPFFQTADLSYADSTGRQYDPVAELMPDIPKPKKFLFSKRSPEGASSLTLAEAARYLVLTQAYNIAGIKTPVAGNTHINQGKVFAPKGLAGTGWCGAIGGTFVEGANLFETLMLNFVLFDKRNDNGCLLDIDGDVPPWERESPSPDLVQTNPRGPVQMLTWQGRRIRLVPDGEPAKIVGVVICYGDVTAVADKQDCETMTPWRASIAQQKKLGTAHVPWLPRQHEPRKALWRSLPALLSAKGGSSAEGANDLRPGVLRWVNELADDGMIGRGYRLAVHAQGVNYDSRGSSVYEDAVDDSVDMYALMVRGDADAVEKCVEVVGQAEDAVRCLANFVAEVEMAHGDKRRYDKFTDDTASAVKADVQDRAFDELDGLFRARVAGFSADVDPLSYCNDWRREVRGILLRLSDDYLVSTGASLFEERINRKTGKAFSAGSASAKLRRVLARVLPSEAEGDDTSRDAG